jgi:hypothetical protein
VLLISAAPAECVSTAAEKEIDMKSKYRSRIDRQHIYISWLEEKKKSWSDSKIIVMKKEKKNQSDQEIRD